MKHIDLHSRVIPETIIRAMRDHPDVYNTQIEGEGNKRVFVRGKTRFELLSEFYDAQAKVESMDRKGLVDFGPRSYGKRTGRCQLPHCPEPLWRRPVMEIHAKNDIRERRHEG
jgi:hypothetical protein